MGSSSSCRPRSEQRPLNELLDALAHHHRRRVLTRLDHAESAVPLDDLDVREADVDLLHERLYHVHLPKLERAGFIEWDKERNVVRPGPRYDDVAPLVALLRGHADGLPGDWP